MSGIPSIFRTHDLGHASSAAYFNRLTPAGLTFAEDSVRFLYQQMNTFELAEIELGDLNQDGVVNLLDIAPFVELLSIGGYRKEADISQDGVLNLLDVDPFVTLLSGQ